MKITSLFFVRYPVILSIMALMVITLFQELCEAQGKGATEAFLTEAEVNKMIDSELSKISELLRSSELHQVGRYLGMNFHFTAGSSIDAEEERLDRLADREVYEGRPYRGYQLVNHMANKAFKKSGKMDLSYELWGVGKQAKQAYNIQKFAKNGLPVPAKNLMVSVQGTDKLQNTFALLNVAAYCLTLANAMGEFHEKGFIDSSFVTKLKLVTGGIGVYLALTGKTILGPFGGSVIWLLEWSIDKAHRGVQIAKADQVLSFYRQHFDHIKWPEQFQAGSFEQIEKTLRSYWDVPKIDGHEARLADWALATVPNCKNYVAHIYMQQIVAPRLEDYFRFEYRSAKEQAIKAFKDYISSLKDRKVRFHLKLRFQDRKGRRFDIPSKFNIEMLFDGKPYKQELYTIKKSSNRYEIEMDFLNFAEMVGKTSGLISFQVIGKEMQGEEILPIEGMPILFWGGFGEDANGDHVKVYHEGNITNVAPQADYPVLLWSYTVRVNVTGPEGSEVLGPDGMRYSPNEKGFVYIPLPTVGTYYLSYVDPAGNITGDALEVKPQEMDIFGAGKSLTVSPTMQSRSVNRTRALPKLIKVPEHDIRDAIQSAQVAIDKFANGDITLPQMDRHVLEAKNTIETEIDDTANALRLYSKVYFERETARGGDANKARVHLKAISEKVEAERKRVREELSQLEMRAKTLSDTWLDKYKATRDALMQAVRDTKEPIEKLSLARADNSYGGKLSVNRQTPQEFLKLSDVGKSRVLLSKYSSTTNQSQSASSALLTSLIGVSTKLEQTLLEYERLRKLSGVTIRASGASQGLKALASVGVWTAAGEALREEGGFDTTLRGLKRGDEIMAWLEERALKQKELIKDFDQLADNPPEGVKPNEAMLRIQSELSDAYTAAKWSASIARRKRRGYSDEAAYGVAAWLKSHKALEEWKSIKTKVTAEHKKALAWSKAIEEKLKELSRHTEEIRKGGWIVRDIYDQLSARLARKTKKGKERINGEQIKALDKQVQNFLSGFANSQVSRLAPWSALAADVAPYAKHLKAGIAALNAGDLREAEHQWKQTEGLWARKAEKGIASGYGAPTELLLDVETYTLEEEFLMLLNKARLEKEKTDLATLSIIITGGSPDLLQFSILDLAGQKAIYEIYGSGDKREIKIKAGKYKLFAKAQGLKVKPAEKALDLARASKHMLSFRLESAVSSGTGSLEGVTAQSIANVKKRPLALGIMLDDDARPGWSSDSRTVIVPGRKEQGLLAFDLRKNSFRQLVTKVPQPLSGTESTRVAFEPFGVGDSVVYRFGIDNYYSGAGNYQYWMTVPLSGGEPVMLFRNIKERYRVIASRYKNGAQVLLAGTEAGAATVFGMRGVPLSLDRVDKIVTIQGSFHSRITASGNWKVIATGEFGADLSVYDRSGKRIALISKELCGRWSTLSPRGSHVACDRVDPATKKSSIVIVPVKDQKAFKVAVKGANSYGLPGWSPDGRYLAMRAYGDMHPVELLLVDLMGTKPNSFAQGGPIYNSGSSKAQVNAESKANSNQQIDLDTGEPVKDDAQERRAYQRYIKAYNKLTSLMAAGEGDTEKAKKAHEEYLEERKRYEESMGK